MYRSVLLAAILIWPWSSLWAMTDVQDLEKELIESGESPELLIQLVAGYVDLNDGETARLYLDYLQNTFPEFVIESDTQISALADQIEFLLKKSRSEGDSAIYQLSAGVDSNASQGTSLSQLDLQLANGEKLVLAVSSDSQEISSAYAGIKSIKIWNLGEELQVRSSVEHVRYQESGIATMSLGSVEVTQDRQSIALYGFRRSSTRVGLIYRGAHENVFWSGQIDDDERRLVTGVEGQMIESSPLPNKWSAHVFRSEFESGSGNANRRIGVQLKVGWNLNNAQVGYSLEHARDGSVYDRIFFPGVRDQYVWQRIAAVLPISATSDQRISFELSYNDKKHDISINSWRGLDLRFVFSAPFQ